MKISISMRGFLTTEEREKQREALRSARRSPYYAWPHGQLRVMKGAGSYHLWPLSDVTAERLARLLSEHPALNEYGYGDANHFLPGMKHQHREITNIENVMRAARWLERFYESRPQGRYCSSYGLKHVMEHDFDVCGTHGYVSNGEFIAAGLLLGYRARIFCDSPNVFFLVKEKTHRI